MSSFFQAGKTPVIKKSGKTEEATPVELPWVEKYRPKTLSDVSSQEEVVSVLRTAITSQNLPHLLFYGPPGTGKTSTILALAREIYGAGLIKSRVLELNASDERGIQVVREKIKNFAQIYVSAHPGSTAPPYKLIILDEADSMTGDAQAALRRTIETYSRVTRFCLICNYVSRIIEPLASRCAKFRFQSLSAEASIERLALVAETEGIDCAPGTLEGLVEIGGGDMRKAITYLQSASQIKGGKGGVTMESVESVAGYIPKGVTDRLLGMVREGGGYEVVRKGVEETMAEGYSANQLLAQLHDAIIVDSYLTEGQKARIGLVMGQMDQRLVDGADEELQVMDLLLRAQRIVQAV